MRGFTYPGVSPIKGKQKQADLAAADMKSDDATEMWKDAMSKEHKGTDLMKGNDPKYGQVPLAKRAPLKDGVATTMGPKGPTKLPVDMGKGMTTNTGYTGDTPPSTTTSKESFGSKVKGAAASSMGQALGQAAGEAIIGGAVNLAVGALSSKKEKPVRKGGSQAAFSNVKLGRS